MKFAERGKVNRDLVNIVHNNVRESKQVVGDIYSLAACNETGHRRLIDMLDEFAIDDIDALAGFIFERSLAATIERISGAAQRHLSQHHARRRLWRADRHGCGHDGRR